MEDDYRNMRAYSDGRSERIGCVAAGKARQVAAPSRRGGGGEQANDHIEGD